MLCPLFAGLQAMQTSNNPCKTSKGLWDAWPTPCCGKAHSVGGHEAPKEGQRGGVRGCARTLADVDEDGVAAVHVLVRQRGLVVAVPQRQGDAITPQRQPCSTVHGPVCSSQSSRDHNHSSPEKRPACSRDWHLPHAVTWHRPKLACRFLWHADSCEWSFLGGGRRCPLACSTIMQGTCSSRQGIGRGAGQHTPVELVRSPRPYSTAVSGTLVLISRYCSCSRNKRQR